MVCVNYKTFLLGTLLLVCLLSVMPIFTASTHAQESTLTSRATAPPTNTRRANSGPAVTATPFSIPARLCSDCTRIRLRATPGTAGEVLDYLDSRVQFAILGRTADSEWVEIRITPGNTVGWVSAQYVRMPDLLPIDSALLNSLPVLGAAVEASPTSTSSVGIPSWLSGITFRSRQIFAQGQRLGNRANVFSKVGDSITISPYFLTPIGNGQYELGAYGSLSRVIAFFSQTDARAGNSFANPSLAAGGGWSAFDLLRPESANKAICEFDSPLVCEYKHVKPSIALIMVGTNDSGSGSADQFAGNLRQIVQISMDMGVIPVLSTIPPRHVDADQTARVEAFNRVIRLIAQQNDVPLWDYWALMEAAPNYGMSADALHPSVPPDGAAARFSTENLQYGYTIRNLSALQVLDVLWRLVLS
jgi:GDSL-like Lipase/Acylhydrolase family/Bacterial SH3 domain